MKNTPALKCEHCPDKFNCYDRMMLRANVTMSARRTQATNDKLEMV